MDNLEERKTVAKYTKEEVDELLDLAKKDDPSSLSLLAISFYRDGDMTDEEYYDGSSPKRAISGLSKGSDIYTAIEELAKDGKEKFIEMNNVTYHLFPDQKFLELCSKGTIGKDWEIVAQRLRTTIDLANTLGYQVSLERKLIYWMVGK